MPYLLAAIVTSTEPPSLARAFIDRKSVLYLPLYSRTRFSTGNEIDGAIVNIIQRRGHRAFVIMGDAFLVSQTNWITNFAIRFPHRVRLGGKRITVRL
jgi:hypothetical protein